MESLPRSPLSDNSSPVISLLLNQLDELNKRIEKISSQVADLKTQLPENFSELRISSYGSIEEINSLNQPIEDSDLY